MQKASSELKKFLDRKAFNKKAETSGAAALSIGDLIYDMARIDPTYVKGAQFSRPEAVDISSKFKIGKQNINIVSIFIFTSTIPSSLSAQTLLPVSGTGILQHSQVCPCCR